MASPLLHRNTIRRRWLVIAAAVCGSVFAQTLPLNAQAGPARPELQIEPIGSPPVIDGHLDDLAWQQPPLPTGEWRS